MKRILTREHQARKQIRKAIHFLFVGSGVAEGRLQDGDGPTAEAIWKALDRRRSQRNFALRCCQLSNRWEEFWELRSVT